MPGQPLELVEEDSFLFVCPLCARKLRQAELMEPMCTGPSWTNDHEPTVMRRLP